MENFIPSSSHRILFFNFLSFTVCFAIWLLNGVLVTYLVDSGLFHWNTTQMGWLLGIPILTGSIFRLPFGMLTDKFGGRWVMGVLLFFLAIPLFLLSRANNFWEFALCSLGFGMAGNAFSIGIAYTSVWYPSRWQGRALGIFGAGNAGAAITTALAPMLLNYFTENNAAPDKWRLLPQVYAAATVLMGLFFILFTKNKKSPAAGKTISEMLQPLKQMRVWRFGLYYYLVFGCFVALAQWLVPYYLNLYSISLLSAGLLATVFSFPSGVVRIAGGWVSDKFNAKKTMLWVLGISFTGCLFLIPPRMEIHSPGEGIMAKKSGKVKEVTDTFILVDEEKYLLIPNENNRSSGKEIVEASFIFPEKVLGHEAVVKEGDVVFRKQLIAKGISKIYFQANIWIATVLIFIVGIAWGIGKAAVYKFIPDYYPENVGAVGGVVGTLGGLGGFFSPIIFGYLLQWTGLWTSMWIFLAIISLLCFLGMQKDSK